MYFSKQYIKSTVCSSVFLPRGLLIRFNSDICLKLGLKVSLSPLAMHTVKQLVNVLKVIFETSLSIHYWFPYKYKTTRVFNFPEHTAMLIGHQTVLVLCDRTLYRFCTVLVLSSIIKISPIEQYDNATETVQCKWGLKKRICKTWCNFILSSKLWKQAEAMARLLWLSRLKKICCGHYPAMRVFRHPPALGQGACEGY